MILEGLEHLASGKVREIYAVDPEHLLIVASDRVSAYDVVLPTPVPGKGVVLTQLSAWWFQTLFTPGEHHLVTADIRRMPEAVQRHAGTLAGRSTLARRAEVFPVECVVRGYLSGSGWKDYCATGRVCGIPIPEGMQESAQLPEPIFTPATKAATGHDENIPFATMAEVIGADVAEELRRRSLDLYGKAAAKALARGIIIADTKLEFGRLPGGQIVCIDEVFTPDSSRFWPAEGHVPGSTPPSFDKQFVRDYLTSSGWNKEPPAPALPESVVTGTRERYIQAYELITGQTFDF